jgi:hypothetical protein
MSFNKKVAKVACEMYNDLPNDNQSNKKYMSEIFDTEKSSFNSERPKVARHFYCETCDYNTCKKSNWKKHLETKTHSLNKSSNFFNKSIICTLCNKNYKTRTGLWYHSKKCKGTLHTENVEKEGEDILDNPNLLVELMKQNTEFKNIIIDQNKTIMELAKNNSSSNNNSYNNNNNTNNSHNKFNLNFFLNEQCKDAMSIKEFIDNIKLNITDLDITREFGLAESISRIFLRNLKELDVYKRPIHCSDLKREVVYLKDENGWMKDDDNKKKLASLIRSISNKNIKQIPEWVAAHPNCKDSSNPHNDKYLMMLSESMGSFSDRENELTQKKIIRNVLKSVVIDKK